MKLYAELPLARVRQIAADLAVAAGLFLSVRLGLGLRRLVERLAAPGQTIENAGQRVAGSLGQAAEVVAEVPFAGNALRSPFAAAAGAGQTLAEAGQAQQDAVITLALWLGVLVAAPGVLAILLWYLPRRAAWVREASAAARLRDASADLRLFAYRAVAMRPLPRLRKAVPDPGAALAAQDFDALASLELQALGLRPSR
ncbi:MAG: hypothetical protein M3N32_00695 [Actinomycetota bacterium]|nr:hypothetical protein [Actinomycetota bacterium]